jgi:hypothetical protein
MSTARQSFTSGYEPLYGRFDDEGGYMPTEDFEIDEGSPWTKCTSFLDEAITPFSSDAHVGGYFERRSDEAVAATHVAQLQAQLAQSLLEKQHLQDEMTKRNAQIAADVVAAAKATEAREFEKFMASRHHAHAQAMAKELAPELTEVRVVQAPVAEHKVRLLPMPQRYSGTDPAVIVEDAIFAFESFLKASHIPMKDWPAHIMPILSGQALTTYVAHARPMSTRGEDMTWADMVKILTDAFSTVDSKIVARKELLAIQQTTTVTEYAQRMRILIARAGSPASSDLDLMLMYFNGLKPYMQQKCQVDPTKGTFWGSFEQLLQFSLSVSVGTGPTQRPAQAQAPAWKTRGLDRFQGQGQAQGQGASMPDKAPSQPPTQVAGGDARPPRHPLPPPPFGPRRDSNPHRVQVNAMKLQKRFKQTPALASVFCAGCARGGFMANHATGAANCQTPRVD